MSSHRTSKTLVGTAIVLTMAALLAGCFALPGGKSSTPTPVATPSPTATVMPVITPTSQPSGISLKPLGALFAMTVGERVGIEDSSWLLQFDGIADDSRCPVDVTCVWAGEVTAQFSAFDTDEAVTRLEVTLGPRTTPTTLFGGLSLTLLAVEPEPRSSTSIATADYIVEVVVDRLADEVESGIRGIVTLGPLCPVAREDQPCPDKPYEATIVIEDSTGVEVARAISGPDGRYSQALQPGTYRLVPLTPSDNILPIASPVTLVLSADEWLTVDISYDTGIR